MARPCKALATMSKNLTKDEINARKETEERLKGGSDKITPPGYLSAAQKKLFKFIVGELEASGILCNLDIYTLSTCVIAIDRLQAIEAMINKDFENLMSKELMTAKEKYTKDFFRCTNELSLSPQSRAKLSSINLQAKQKDDDPLLKLLAGGKNG